MAYEGPHDGSHPEDCYRCKLSSLTLGKPKDFPTRTRSKAEPARPANSYEAGIPTDSRGMPWLDPKTFQPMHQKAVENNRHLIEEHERRKRQAPATPTRPEVI